MLTKVVHLEVSIPAVLYTICTGWKLNVTYANMYIFPDMCSNNEHAKYFKTRAPRDIVKQDTDNYDYDDDWQCLIKTEAYDKHEMWLFYLSTTLCITKFFFFKFYYNMTTIFYSVLQKNLSCFVDGTQMDFFEG